MDSHIGASIVIDFFEVVDCFFVVRLSLIKVVIGFERVDTTEEIVREAKSPFIITRFEVLNSMFEALLSFFKLADSQTGVSFLPRFF